MPSKTLLATSDLVHAIREGGALAVSAPEPKVDLAKLIARKREVIKGFADYRIDGINAFPLYEGLATFLSSSELQVGADTILEGKSFVIGTGSVVAPAVVPGLAEAGFIDSDAALDLEKLPGSLVVLGGGYVASELGQYFARLGVSTTMIIRARHLLSGEDDDVGDALTLYFRDEGIDVRSGAQVTHVELRDGKKVVHYLRDGEAGSVTADEIFYALGRVPNVEGLGLDQAGVRYHAISGVEVGPDMRTSTSNVYAVGDVTGQFPLVHVAIYQGEIAARNAILGTDEIADYTLQRTHTIFTDPQVAVAGATEKELQRAGTPFVSGAYLFSEHGKAISINRTKGFVKMLADPSDGRILGAAIVGPEASDLIHEIVVAMYYRGTVHDFVKIPHLHPTLAEIWTYPAEEAMARIAEIAQAENARAAIA